MKPTGGAPSKDKKEAQINIVCELEGIVDASSEELEQMTKAKITNGFDYVLDLTNQFQQDIASMIGGLIPKDGQDRQLGLYELSEPVVYSNGSSPAIRLNGGIKVSNSNTLTIRLGGGLKVYFGADEIITKIKTTSADRLAAVETCISNLVWKLGRGGLSMTSCQISITDDKKDVLRKSFLNFEPVEVHSDHLQSLMRGAF